MTVHRPSDFASGNLPVRHRPKAAVFAEVEPLVALCKLGKLYEVEQWIADGRPIQAQPPDDRKLVRKPTPLGIAVARGFHSLAGLLLANGYDPNGDYYEQLSPAVSARNHDLVELLLQYGADPASVDFCEVLETCDRPLMDRFVGAGVDPCAGNAVARALERKGRPILGFVKTYRDRFPGLQRQVDLALHYFVEQGDEKGVSLMMWLGADPTAAVPSDPYLEDGDNEQLYENALETAVGHGRSEILGLLRVDPRKVPVDRLLFTGILSHSMETVRRLIDLGANPNAVDEGGSVLHWAIQSVLWSGDERFGRSYEPFDGSFAVLTELLARGAKYQASDRSDLGSLRRGLLRCQPGYARRVIDLLGKHHALTDGQTEELLRTPAIRRHLQSTTGPSGYSAPAAPAPNPRQNYFQRRRWWNR